MSIKRLPRLSELPSSISEDELWALFGDMEYERLDFKESANSLKEIIPAMAMTLGGIVICGVTDTRQIIGCPLAQKTLDKIARAGHETGVDVQVHALEVDEHELTIVAIPEVRDRIVTTTDGRLLRRVGSDNQPLRGDALGRFVRSREERSGEDEPIAHLDYMDLDLELINRALVSDERPPIRRRAVGTLSRALVDLGVSEVADASLDPQVLRAAVLLFSRQPTRYVKAAAVQIVRRVGVGPGPGPVSAREDIDGPIPALLERTLAFIDKHTSHHEAVVGTHRETFAEYPPAVLREAILNALAHRDYGLVGATVDVTIWDDRIEIHSPGPLPGHITTENMRSEHYSRNRRIMRVLKTLNLVEEYGEGVDRMFHEMEARLMEPPHFAATPSSVTVALYNRSILSIEDQAWLALLGHLEDLTVQERRTLVVARHEEGVTPRRLRSIFGDSFDVDALIASTVAKGLLVRIGRGGGARYVLSDEVVMRAGGAGVEARSRKRQMLLDEIHRRGHLSTAEATDFLSETDRALVRQMLDDLVRSRQAYAEGRTRARRYYLADSRRTRPRT
ncbi:MAG TPA: ATP-binding protein [Solirubrobacteraceae bacterium]|nr:ATP-binding protein [Solirubrobacteraceae bacterium]